jgi:hypothetical protein
VYESDPYVDHAGLSFYADNGQPSHLTEKYKPESKDYYQKIEGKILKVKLYLQ